MFKKIMNILKTTFITLQTINYSESIQFVN
jgi:hypothetical protein